MMSHLCNRCVREFLILARTWFAFGLPSKTGCDTTRRLTAARPRAASPPPAPHRLPAHAPPSARSPPSVPPSVPPAAPPPSSPLRSS
uniref:Uncharacterized protein n=1 Tax=Zea mays TaxID=4577 RepID=C0PAL9_MAIZE|nr:unknown [Zea mays]